MSTTTAHPSTPTYDDFRSAWLEDVLEGEPSTVELGRRFAQKLVRQWIDADSEDLEIIYCDGAGDGGIDLAALRRGEAPEMDADLDAPDGDVWYLVQSKYGTAFQGPATLFEEGRKVIASIDGAAGRRSSLAAELLERLTTFRALASERDRLILVFATTDPLDEDGVRALEDLTAMGRARLGPIFDVKAISIDTVYRRQLDLDDAVLLDELALPISGALTTCGEDLLVGAVPILDLYAFMKAYQRRTGDLDRLYEKNIRRFLGGRGKVNKNMQATLRNEPERFGLYNNGITIVVEGFRPGANGTFELIDPFVVNGCQTTRSVWEVCHRLLESGGTGRDPELEAWKSQAEASVVVAKIVKVGERGEALLEAITRYTNSQNAVREKDFISLTKDFKAWAEDLKREHGLFLEVQRGDWDSYRALQRKRADLPSITNHANAFDLLKVYGAGWLRCPGRSFGGSRAFVPGGSVFRTVTSPDHQFGVDDLRAAWILYEAAIACGYGRGANAKHRRQTRFVFYFAAVELLRRVIGAIGTDGGSAITAAVLTLADSPDRATFDAWLQEADATVEEYMNDQMEFSAYAEPGFKDVSNGDLNAFLKSERLGQDSTYSPGLLKAIQDHFRMLGRSAGGGLSPKAAIEVILSAKP